MDFLAFNQTYLYSAISPSPRSPRGLATCTRNLLSFSGDFSQNSLVHKSRRISSNRHPKQFLAFKLIQNSTYLLHLFHVANLFSRRFHPSESHQIGLRVASMAINPILTYLSSAISSMQSLAGVLERRSKNPRLAMSDWVYRSPYTRVSLISRTHIMSSIKA